LSDVILHEYYGWRIHRRPELLHADQRGYRVGGGERGYTVGGQKFRPEEIGRAQYHKTMVTLSRATARLEQRGLVTCLVGGIYHWSGVELTPEGRRLAAEWTQAAGEANG
jgi:hypothetical protein